MQISRPGCTCQQDGPLAAAVRALHAVHLQLVPLHVRVALAPAVRVAQHPGRYLVAAPAVQPALRIHLSLSMQQELGAAHETDGEASQDRRDAGVEHYLAAPCAQSRC